MEASPQGVYECVLSRWWQGFNDPYLSSWIMVLIYLVAAALSFRMASNGVFPVSTRRRERLFWALIGGLLLALAINKQADLQSFLTVIGRCLAKSQGWYGERRMVQKIFFLVMGICVAGGAGAMLWGLRRRLYANLLPLLGLACMAGFILSRAADAFHLDTRLVALLNARWTGRVLELSGPLIISIAAIRSLFSSFSRAQAKDGDPPARR